jgi:drug/metabolite transporter (DMT)-like permease
MSCSALVHTVLPALGMIMVGAIFGGYSVLTSVVLSKSTVSALVFAFSRDLVASAVLLCAAALAERRRRRQQPPPPSPPPRFLPEWRDAGSFLLLGLTGVWGAQGMSALSIKFSTATFFSAMTNLQPVVTFTLSLALGLEPFRRGWALSWAKVAAVAAAAASGLAVVLLASAGGAASITAASANFPLGLAFALLQILLGGSLPVVQKPLFARYSPLVLCAWGYAVGTALLAMSVVTGATGADDWAGVGSTTFLAGVAYAGVLSSAVAYAIMAAVNAALSPTFVAIFMPGTAFWTVLFAWLFQGKTLANELWGPLAGIWVGVAALVVAQRAEAAAAAELGGSGGGGGRKRLLDDDDDAAAAPSEARQALLIEAAAIAEAK